MNPLITVVVLENRESPALLEAAKQLKELNCDFELYTAKNWQEGLGQAQGEYICFLEPDSKVSDRYFAKNLNIFQEKINYRKLVMVSSAVDIQGQTIYGFKQAPGEITPSAQKSSTSPYGVQIGYFPGALIRKTAYDKIKLETQLSPIRESADLSLQFWKHGWRCVINPNTTYKTTDCNIRAIDLDTIQVELEPLTIMFKREMIG